MSAKLKKQRSAVEGEAEGLNHQDRQSQALVNPKSLQNHTSEQEITKGGQPKPVDEEDKDAAFRNWYVQQITKCFGEEIDSLRRGTDTFVGTAEDLSSLIVALRTGESDAVFEQAAKDVVIHSIKAEKHKKKKKKASN